MIPLSIRQIRQTVAGKALSPIPADAPPVASVCTDSRRMEKSSLFVAIRGDTHDGHQHLSEAAAGGAVAAIVEQPPTHPVPNVIFIQVANTRVALGKLARHVRQQMKRCKVIAVAGSNGKTSTKHLIDAALRKHRRGSVSPKSFNNDIGVPLTIFPADPAHDYLVLEMGTNHHGEIRVLSEMAIPDIAVITNCGAEHLEGLDDLMGVRRENAAIISGLNPSGLLIVNGDDSELASLVADFPGMRLTFGFKETNDLFATDIRCSDRGVEFNLNGSKRRVFVPMLGRHSAANALAAIAVGRKFGIEESAIVQSLTGSTSPDMRLQLQKLDGITVLNDAYNANPNSMRAAIETIAALPSGGRHIAVLGEMRELGRSSERYHREIGAFAATDGKLDLLACVGAGGAIIADAAIAAGFPAERVYRFIDAIEAAAQLPEMLNEGDLVLLKASRGVRLEQVASGIARRSEIARRAAS